MPVMKLPTRTKSEVKRMKKILAIFLFAVLLGSIGMVLADKEERGEGESPSTAINKTHAESIALDAVKAKYGSGYAVVESELEKEKGNSTWVVELKNSTAEVKVEVDGDSGSILSMKFKEKENEKHEEKEREGERERSMKFEERDGSYDGRFTEFEFDRQILNYTVNGTLVFERIEINAARQEIKSAGAEIKIEISDDIKIDAHDNPTGLLKIDAEKEITIKLVAASGITIARTSNRTISLTGSSLNGTLMIAGKGEFSVEGRNITATLNHGKLIFRAKPSEDYGERETHRNMEREMEQEHLGAEVHIKGKKDLDAVIYTDLSVNVTEVDTVNKTISVNVSSPTHEGRFIIFNIDSSVLGAIQSGGYKVLIDGKAVDQARDIQDLLNARTQNASKYLVTIGSSGAQVIVYVKEFSEHTITIYASAPSVIPGFEASLLLIAIGLAMMLFRRR